MTYSATLRSRYELQRWCPSLLTCTQITSALDYFKTEKGGIHQGLCCRAWSDVVV